MVMVKMVKIENGKKEKYSIIYKYIYLYIIVQKWPFRKSILTKMTMTTLTTFDKNFVPLHARTHGGAASGRTTAGQTAGNKPATE